MGLSICQRLARIWMLGLFEGIGMGIFTFIVTGVVLSETQFGVLTIALALTLAISIMAPTTGGHINPAVTITLLLAGLLGTERVKKGGDIGIIVIQSVMYLVFQFSGAIVASIFCRWMVDADGNIDVFFDAIKAYNDNYLKVCITETLGTMLLCFTVTCLVYRQAGGDLGPALVGLTVLVSAEVLGKFSGGFFNPALVVGMICSGLTFMSQEEYAAEVPGYNASMGVMAAEFTAVWLGSQFLGAILAWMLNMMIQIAKRRHDKVISSQMSIGANEQQNETSSKSSPQAAPKSNQLSSSSSDALENQIPPPVEGRNSTLVDM